MWRVALLGLVAGCSYSPTRGSSIDSTTPGDSAPPVDEGIDAADAPPDSAVCPANYVTRDGSSYRFVGTTAAWLAAEQDCENDGFGTHLVVIENPSELAAVDAISSASLTWLGASDRVTDGTWLWVTGAAAPFNAGDPDECAQFYDGTGGGTPNDQTRGCTSTAAYLCECDLVPANPATY